MRTFDYREKWKKLLTPEIVSYLTQIHEFKGEQKWLLETKSDILTRLADRAKTQSTGASNKLAGVDTSDVRLKALVRDTTRPRTHNEREIAGYRDVLNAIHENYEYLPTKLPIILQLHRDLYKFESGEAGGEYRTSDSIIEKINLEGNIILQFQPAEAVEIPEAMDVLCQAFADAIAERQAEPLLLIPMFILDFLCIHPFHTGTGRMSQLLTLLLLNRAGYFVGKYISMEQLIKESKDDYYNCLQRSAAQWHGNKTDYEPFVKYMLEIIAKAYCDLKEQVKLLTTEGLSKTDRVREIIHLTNGTITKAEILEKCPDISQVTVQRALADLVDSGKVLKIGGGRYTKYTWNN